MYISRYLYTGIYAGWFSDMNNERTRSSRVFEQSEIIYYIMHLYSILYIYTLTAETHTYIVHALHLTTTTTTRPWYLLFIMQLEVYMYKSVCVYACAPRIYLNTSAVHLNFSLVSRRDFIMYARISRMYKGRIRYCVRI